MDREGAPVDLPIVGMYGAAANYRSRMRKGSGQ